MNRKITKNLSKSIRFTFLLFSITLLSTSINAQTTFNYTGSIQNYTVPSGITRIRIDAQGAQGGSVTISCAATGGLGARMVGEVNVTPGEVLSILVGGQGQSNGEDGGGGGGSFVVRTGNIPLVVAGGGGGGRSANSNSSQGGPGSATNTPTNSINGSGNGTGGSSGNGGQGGPGANIGATYPAGGGGGAGWLSDGTTGLYTYGATGGASPSNGAAGGVGFNPCGSVNIYGGYGGGGGAGGCSGASGGGGGYNGGGGGNCWNGGTWGSGGGGGSYNNGTNQSNTAGSQTGNGLAVITELNGPCALDFDGSNDFVSIPHNANQVGLTSLTMEAWVKITGSTGPFRNIIMKGNYGYGMAIDFTNKLGYWSDPSYSNCPKFGTIPMDTWTHVAIVVVQNTSVTFYINGVNVGSSTSAGHTTINNGANDPLFLGYQGTGCACNYFQGSMDEVRMWNTARTQAQIQANMNCELAAQSNLIALYHMNGGTANSNNAGKTTCLDESSGSNSGTLTNFALSSTSSNWVDPGVGQEISVNGNNNLITDGDATPTSGDFTDFGSLTTRTFKIKNTGSAALKISGITFTGTNPTEFSVTTPPASNVAAGDSSAFVVTFNAGGPGVRTATVNINNSDCDEGAYDFVIQATAANAFALNFDGTNDNIEVTGYTAPTAYTIEAWVKPNSTGNQNIIVGTNIAGPNSNYSHQLRIAGGKWSHYTYDGGQHFVTSATSVSTSSWTHVAIVATNNGKQRLFINGIEEGTAQNVGTLWTALDRYAIGSSSGGGMGFFNGTIDEVRVWNYARSCGQLQSTMNCNLLGNETGLIAYYQCNQGIPSGNNPNDTLLLDNQTNVSVKNGKLSNFALTGATSNWVAPGSAVTGTTPASFAGISISGNAVVISSGTTSVTSANFTDFGIVQTGNNLARKFVISNTGTSNLTITTPISISGAGFTVLNQPASNVAAGDTTSFIVQFAPASVGAVSGTISISNSGCDANPYTFAIQGIGYDPTVVGAALQFDGSNDYITVSNHSSFDLTGDLTMEAWVNLNNLPSDWVRVIGKGTFTDRTYGLWISSSGQLLYQHYGITSNQFFGPTLNTNTWYHIAVSRKAGAIIMYVNGVNVASSTYTGTPFTTTNPLTVGYAGFHTYFPGTMDEVRLWNYGRCSTEIANNMNCEIPGTPAGLVLYYKMNQGIAFGNNTSITTATDSSNNVQNGTLTNFGLNMTASSNFVYPGAVTSGVSCTTPGGAGINVYGNFASITDGDLTPSSSDFTDIGSAGVSLTSSKTFKIKNTGSGSLTINTFVFTGINSSDFGVSGLTLPATIAASDSAAFTINFTPSAVGVRNAVLHITNSDCINSDYDFAVKGLGDPAGAALNFDGTDDRIDLGNVSALNFSKTSPITIESWIKSNKASLDQQVATKRDVNNKGWGVQVTNGAGREGKVEFYLIGNYGGGDNLWIRSNYPTDIRDTQWHHIAATYDGSNSLTNMKIYIDGVDYGSTSLQAGSISSDITNTGNATVGGYWFYSGVPSEFFNGSLDETRIWNRYMCQAEIVNNKNCEIATSGNKLLLNLHYNQGVAGGSNGAVTTANDASGNSNNGTLTNFALTGSTSNWIAPGAVTSGVSCAANCSANNARPTVSGTFTSSTSSTDVNGYTHYCDCQNKLLLSLKLGGTGAAVPDNGVQLKVTSMGATFYPSPTGFVVNGSGWSGLDRTWNVVPSTQPTSPIPVRFYFNSTDVTNINNSLIANSVNPIGGPDSMTFYKVTNPIKPAHAAVASLIPGDIKVIFHGSSVTDSTWTTGVLGGGNYFAEFAVTSFSGGGGGAGPDGITPLPVELLYLTAKAVDNNHIKLDWATASEINSNYFDVQRSTDGVHFTTIGNVKAAGNSFKELLYTLNDFNVQQNVTYFYRLNMVDLNGSHEYSNVVLGRLNSAASNNAGVVTMYPNPAKTELNIVWPEGLETADIAIRSVEGKTVLTQRVDATHKSVIGLQHLLPGIYTVSLTINGEIQNQKLVIQK